MAREGGDLARIGQWGTRVPSRRPPSGPSIQITSRHWAGGSSIRRELWRDGVHTQRGAIGVATSCQFERDCLDQPRRPSGALLAALDHARDLQRNIVRSHACGAHRIRRAHTYEDPRAVDSISAMVCSS